MKTTLDLYTDYLLSSFGQTSATGLSRLLNNSLSHDDVTDFLNQSEHDSKALWKEVKPFVRQIESDDGVLIVDDSISEKPHTDPNGLVCPHYDHSKDRYINGINFVTLLYRNKELQFPVGFMLVVKRLQCLLKDKREVWRCETTKNEMFRLLLKPAYQNAVKFGYVLCDSWYVNSANINFIRSLDKHLIGAIKTSLEVAVSAQNRANGKFVKISELDLKVGVPMKVYIRSVKEPVLVCKDIFINENASEGELLLLSTNVADSFRKIISTYQERWGVEDYHKSLKNNASLSKSPTRTPQTQQTHFFASICAYIKLERLKINENLNHFALKGKLYLKAIQAAFGELQDLKTKLSKNENQILLA
ncbi:MAG: transposase [Spirosomataceae bacterium]